MRCGGGVWKSNPPFDPRRAESPALKAGKVTAPFSPPQSEYHHRHKLTGARKCTRRKQVTEPRLTLCGHVEHGFGTLTRCGHSQLFRFCPCNLCVIEAPNPGVD